MFVPLVETAIAFAAVMLATSLFVSAIVQLVQNVLHWRGRTLMDMVMMLFVGFRDRHDDPDAHDQAAASRFAEQVLTDSTLHAYGVMTRYGSDPKKLANLIDYIAPDDLLAVVAMYAEDGKLPKDWFRKGEVPPWATVTEFAAYLKKWFVTVEATHAQEYKRSMRRLTLGISCLVVVLFCLDGLQLVRTLWQNRTAAEALAKQVDTIQATAGRLGFGETTERDTTSKELALELQKTATILDEAEVGIGWQSAWITKRWCAYKGCNDLPQPSKLRLLADAMMWLFGLAFSCVMLSLGAPFWVTTLSSLIRLQNEVQRRKQQPPPPGIGSQTV
jgi:hypothetical protein